MPRIGLLLFTLTLVLGLGGNAAAQHLEATPAEASDGEGAASHARDPRGSLGAEVGGALLGDLAGALLTTTLVLSTADLCVSCESDERPQEPTWLWVSSYALRPLAIGGLTAWLGGRSGGTGRPWVAMLGAMPGSAMMATLFMRDRLDRAGWLTWGAGHVVAVAGSVLAYRLDRHRDRSEPERGSLTASVLVDRERGLGGLSLGGTY